MFGDEAKYVYEWIALRYLIEKYFFGCISICRRDVGNFYYWTVTIDNYDVEFFEFEFIEEFKSELESIGFYVVESSVQRENDAFTLDFKIANEENYKIIKEIRGDNEDE